MTTSSNTHTRRRPLRVYLMDVHPVARLGLRASLEAHSSLTVVGDAATLAEAISAVRLSKPDVLITDTFPLPKRLRDRQRCRVLYTFDTLEHTPLTTLKRYLARGRAGFALKTLALDRFPKAIKQVAAGRPYRDPAFMRLVEERTQQPVSRAGHHDTTRNRRRPSNGTA